MFSTRNFYRFLSLTLVLALLLTVAGATLAQDRKVLVTGVSMVGGDIPTIDPGIAETSSSIEVINQIFVGLMAQEGTTGDPELGIAESYSVSEDGLTYTFVLRQDIPWVHYNPETDAVEQIMDESGAPRMVTANDVVYGMLRSLNPETASPYSYVLVPYIVGAAEFNAGEGAAEDVALTAVDDYTLEIVAPDSVSFAPSIYGLWMARPVPQWAIDEGGDSWTEIEYIATNGPFTLKEWAHEESITIVKNPFWPGTDSIPQAKIDEVQFKFLESTAQFDEYQAGSMDAISLPLEQIDFVKADPTLSAEYVVGTNPCTYYLGFDNTEDPVTNVNLRRALSLSIDREAIVTNVTRGGQIPAQWFSRPGLAAAPTLETNPDLGVIYDAEAAKAALEVALSELGTTADALQLTLSYNDSSNHGAIMQAIQQMWTDTLGITVQLTPLDPSTYFASVSEDAPMIWRSGWCQDYADANNFLYDVFYSKSSQNDPGFNSPEYDALVEQARLETDVDTRRDLYAQAEEILVDEFAAIAPIYWYTTNQLVKPYVEAPASVTGNQSYYDWDVNR